MLLGGQKRAQGKHNNREGVTSRDKYVGYRVSLFADCIIAGQAKLACQKVLVMLIESYKAASSKVDRGIWLQGLEYYICADFWSDSKDIFASSVGAEI